MPQVGDNLGIYALKEYLGGGAFGAVYRAHKRSGLQVDVAIKIPFDQRAAIQLLMEEAEIWQRASGHPNILPVLDADIFDGVYAIVSEYVAGRSLRDRIGLRTGRGLPADETVRLADGILAGLEHLHAVQIIHRDLKPENILRQGGIPRLADFGVARVLSRSGGAASSAGTLLYMPPESFRGKMDARSDLWAVGVILYELLTGSLPFDEDTDQATMFAILQGEPPKLPTSVPAPLRAVVEKALQKEPAKRYSSATDMRQSLASSRRLDPVPHPASPQRVALPSPKGPVLSRRELLIIGGISAVVAGGWGVSKIFSHTGGKSPGTPPSGSPNSGASNVSSSGHSRRPTNAKKGDVWTNPTDDAE